MKKAELIKRRDALKAELQARLAAWETEGHVPTADEWTSHEAGESELAELNQQIESCDKLQAKARANAASLEAQTVGNPRERILDKPWNSLGEQLQSIAFASMPQGRTDPRLMDQTLAPSGASEGIPSDGGFLVTEDRSTALLAKAQEAAVLAPRCNTITLTSSANTIALPYIAETSRATGSRWGGVRVYRRDEAATVTASKPKFGELNVKVEPLMGLAYATEELLADAGAIDSIFTNAFTSEFAFVIDDEIFRGDGAAKCLGAISAACLVSQDAETGQAADTVITENLIKMYSRMPARNKRNAAWFINSEIVPQLMTMTLDVGTGGVPVYMPPGGLSAAPYGSLFGRPVIEIEQASAIGDVGDILFADFGEYLLVRKGGLNGAQSMHVKFIYNEMTFRWTYRVNGQPSWPLAVTQYKGTPTKSPFVALAAR